MHKNALSFFYNPSSSDLRKALTYTVDIQQMHDNAWEQGKVTLVLLHDQDFGTRQDMMTDDWLMSGFDNQHNLVSARYCDDV